LPLDPGRSGHVVPGLPNLGAVCAEEGFQLDDCALQRVVGATPRPPVRARSLGPAEKRPRSAVKSLEKGARFRVSSRNNPRGETLELDDIHETSRGGFDRLRTDCTPGCPEKDTMTTSLVVGGSCSAPDDCCPNPVRQIVSAAQGQSSGSPTSRRAMKAATCARRSRLSLARMEET
jgi:hypothetical protein